LDKKIFNSLPNKNIHVIQIEKERRRLRKDSEGEGEVDMPYSNRSSIKRHLLNQQPFQRSMSVKMHLLDYLPPQIQYAAWYDCDVLFVKPNCVKDMVDNKPNITPEKPIALRKNNFVGSFVAKKGVSESALKAWHDELLRVNSPSAIGDKPEVRDNIVFCDLFGYDVDAKDAKFVVSPTVWHDAMPRELPYNGSFFWNATDCALHLSNGRCTHLGANNIDELVAGFNLQSYEGHKWCPSMIRRKFKNYGVQWPFCWTPPLIWDG
jgi:hypothetical protein